MPSRGKKTGASKGEHRDRPRSKRKTGRKKPKRPASVSPKPGIEFLDPRLSKAMGHWLRVNIMAIASWRKIAPSEFAREVDESLSKVSYHFRKLVDYGVLELVGIEQVRGSVKHFYRGTRKAIFGGAAWVELPKSVQDGVAGAALQDLMKVAVRSIESGAFSARDDSYLTWEPVIYDDLAFKAAIKIIVSTRQRLLALQDEAAPRLAKTQQEGMLTAIALSTFEMGPD